jgi:hypothetical protein
MIHIIMVSTKRVKLNIDMDIDIPIDLLANKDRIRIIEDGVIKSISKGLYEEGISFHLKNLNFRYNISINQYIFRCRF